MTILIATDKPFALVAVNGIREIVEKVGHELALLENYTEKQQLLDAVKNADALIVRSDKVDMEVLGNAPKLKVVVRAGAGIENVDLDAATDRGVCVMNTPGQNANAVAELVIGMLIFVQRYGFDASTGTELKGKKLGIHAFGNIGKIVADIARGFGMEVYAYSRSLAANPELATALNVIPVPTVEALYETCNIVSLHMPTNKDTIGSVNYDLMSRLPADGTVINTARKEVMNETDVLRIMSERPKFKYASDIKPDNWKEMDEANLGTRYFVTPKKCGAQTSEANINAGLAAANQIVDFFATGNQQYRVNK